MRTSFFIIFGFFLNACGIQHESSFQVLPKDVVQAPPVPFLSPTPLPIGTPPQITFPTPSFAPIPTVAPPPSPSPVSPPTPSVPPTPSAKPPPSPTPIPAPLPSSAPMPPAKPSPSPTPIPSPTPHADLILLTVSPNHVPLTGGTKVSIYGFGINPLAKVTIGGAECGQARILLSVLECVTPSNPVGAHDVVVTNPDGNSATIPAGVIYFTGGSEYCQTYCAQFPKGGDYHGQQIRKGSFPYPVNADFSGATVDLTGQTTVFNFQCSNFIGATVGGRSLTQRATGTWFDFTCADLTNAKIEHIDVTELVVSFAELADVQIQDAKLTGLTGTNADFSDARLSDIRVTSISGQSANFTGATFSRITLTTFYGQQADLTRASFRDIGATSFNFTGATLSCALFTLVRSTFNYCDGEMGASADTLNALRCFNETPTTQSCDGF